MFRPKPDGFLAAIFYDKIVSEIGVQRVVVFELFNLTFFCFQGLFNWRRVFVLTTGAGIAPLIPYVVKKDYLDLAISMVWVARDHANNYPKFLVDILDPIPDVVLYDTTKMPRPNLCTMTVEKAREFGAEAVFIVSNPKMAYHVSNYVIKQGIPVFASNFDV